MLDAAISIGLYSFAILILGLSINLYFVPILIVTLLFLCLAFIICIHNKPDFTAVGNLITSNKLLFILISLLAVINMIGALGPELSFDALWYHLTIPKLFLLSHKVYFIRDNLFYYSLMPKLAEMIYTSAISLGGEIIAKLSHFFFGILTLVFLYKLSRIYLTKSMSLLIVLIFYSNLVVDWLSITAYSDLSRSFYEVGALYYFLLYLKSKKEMLLISSAVLLGFAISAKLLAISSIPIFIVLIFMAKFLTLKGKVLKASLFTSLSLVVSLPWFLISFYYTKNPFYPAFSNVAPKSINLEFMYPPVFIKNFIGTFLFSSDPISPIYLIVLMLIVFNIKTIFAKYREIFVYSVCSYFLWYIVSYSSIWYGTGDAGGARFLTAYLPAYSVLTVLAVNSYRDKWGMKHFKTLVIGIGLVSIVYRGIANVRYVPVIFGLETKQDFLMKNLNFSFGDFYDEDLAVKRIVANNTVLLLNMHNLYYVDFPFTLSENDKFKFVLIQNGALPKEFGNGLLVYKNDKTHVKLYRL